MRVNLGYLRLGRRPCCVVFQLGLWVPRRLGAIHTHLHHFRVRTAIFDHTPWGCTLPPTDLVFWMDSVFWMVTSQPWIQLTGGYARLDLRPAGPGLPVSSSWPRLEARMLSDS